jgi:short-subunit dehydrogenase
MALPPPSYGSTILITGASSGIGADLARQLADRGYNVTLTARRRDRLEELAAELREAHDVHVDVEPCDLGDHAARQKLAGKLLSGEREVVGICNNAGFGNLGRFIEHDLEKEIQVVRLNVEAVLELTGAFLPRMVDQGAGAVLNVASTAAFQPLPGSAVYAASKSFVLSFSEAIRTELRGTGVTVTAVCPGPVRTEFTEVAGFEEGVEDNTPSMVWMSAEDVARHAVDGARGDRRVVVPGALNRATALAGQHSPRAFALPLLNRFWRNA